MLDILYIVNIPAPYMVNYFNELGKLCNLTVIFEKDHSSERDKSWKNYTFSNFKAIILKGISTDVDKAFSPQICKYLSRKYNYIFISSMATPTGILAIEYLKFRKIPYILESEGGFAKSGKGLKERFKRHLMSGAYKYFSTTEIGDAYFLQYGAKKEQLVKYPFTSIYESDILKNVISIEERQMIRQELGMNENKIVLSVGQFIYRKGYDVLLNAGPYMDEDIGVYIVGGKITKEYKELIKKHNLKNFYFIDFHEKDMLKKYYMAADAFVLPTREDIWGLVINEAMAYGLPVISTERCIAAMELITDDVEGYIVPIENPKMLADKINLTCKDEFKRVQMGHNVLKRIQWYTFENMAKIHVEYLEGLSK